MAFLEEPGEAFQPLAHVRYRQHRFRLVGKEAAGQRGEPGVVLGVAQPDYELPQRRRTPQEPFGQVAQYRRGRSCHCSASSSRLVATA